MLNQQSFKLDQQAQLICHFNLRIIIMLRCSKKSFKLRWKTRRCTWCTSATSQQTRSRDLHWDKCATSAPNVTPAVCAAQQMCHDAHSKYMRLALW